MNDHHYNITSNYASFSQVHGSLQIIAGLNAGDFRFICLLIFKAEGLRTENHCWDFSLVSVTTEHRAAATLGPELSYKLYFTVGKYLWYRVLTYCQCMYETDSKLNAEYIRFNIKYHLTPFSLCLSVSLLVSIISARFITTILMLGSSLPTVNNMRHIYDPNRICGFDLWRRITWGCATVRGKKDSNIPQPLTDGRWWWNWLEFGPNFLIF